MRIVYLTNFFPPTHTAGTENYTYTTARAFADAGHEVHVLCAGRWNEGDKYWQGAETVQFDGIEVTRLQLNWSLAEHPNRFLYDNPIIAAFTREYLQNLAPDVVHVTSCYTLSASVIRTAKALGLPVVLTLTDFWFLCPSLQLLRSSGELCDGKTTPWTCTQCLLHNSRAYRWPAKVVPERAVATSFQWAGRRPFLARRPGMRGLALDMQERKAVTAAALKQVDKIIAPSRFLGEIYQQVHPELTIEVQLYGHDVDWVDEMQYSSSDEGIRFGYLGQISPVKGVDILINAFLALDAGPETTLSVWGGLDPQTAYGQHIARLAARSPQVRLCGRFARDDLATVMGEIDVVVVPSIWYENNPLVIQEAFAAGKPVIASNLGGMAEFVRPEGNGLLFPAVDVESLTRAMERFISEPDLRSKFSSNVPPVRTTEEEILALTAIYDSLRMPVEPVSTSSSF